MTPVQENCSACKNEPPARWTCVECSGLGVVPTAYGWEILRLVGNYLKSGYAEGDGYAGLKHGSPELPRRE